MAAALIQHGSIRTTEAKAKHVRRFVEKLITVAKKGTLHARRQVVARLQDRDIYTYDEKTKDFELEDQTVIQKLFDVIAPRYADRAGGYTRIIHLAERRIGDAGKQVILQLIEDEPSRAGTGGGGKRSARAAKRLKAAEGIEEKTKAPAAEEPAEEIPADAPEAVEEAPVEEAPAEDAPVEEAPAEEAPTEEAPAEEAPAEEAPAEEAPAEEAPAEEAPAEEAPAEDEAQEDKDKD
jgi:ribosomal protein L17